jgi:hypothetical protein
MTQRERRALLQRLPPAPIAQEVYPHAAGDTCEEAEAVTNLVPLVVLDVDDKALW